MSKTDNRDNKRTYWDEDDSSPRENRNRRKEKRVDRALRTRNIDELIDLEDES